LSPLTLENAGALVPGKKPEENMQPVPAEAKIIVTRPFYHKMEIQEKGKIITLPIRLAQEMVSSNKAEFYYEPYQPTKAETEKGKTEKSKT